MINWNYQETEIRDELVIFKNLTNREKIIKRISLFDMRQFFSLTDDDDDS